MWQTASNNTTTPFSLSTISPPVFIQPLPNTPLVPPSQEVVVDPPSQISFYYPQLEESTPHELPTSEDTHSPSHPSPISSWFAENSLNNSNNSSASPNPYDSPVDEPPTSAFPSESSSPWASESEVLLPSSTKAAKQPGLLDFFSKIPSDEFHARWRKRKREDAEKDREEYEKQKKKEDAEQLHKKARRREQYRVSQSKRRSRLRAEKPVPSVSPLC
jgi:hypothetical protein